jgi:hypothetical protein
MSSHWRMTVDAAKFNINNPIICRYRDGSIGSEFEIVTFLISVFIGVAMDLQSIIPNL